MFEGMKVIAHRDLAVGLASAAVLGGAIATTVLEQLGRRQVAVAPHAELVHAPVVEKSTAFETAVLLNLKVDGKDLACRLWMDHRSKTWSLSC